MAFKSAFVKNSLFVAGAGLLLSLAQISQGQATVSFAGGGSSALQGDYRTASYGPGALPQIIGQLGSIAGYRTSSQTEKVLTVSNTAGDPIEVTRDLPGGGTAVENPDSCQIRFVDTSSGGTASANVIILLRSDSGNGVRYISNRARITRLPVTLSSYASASPTGTTLINNPALAADYKLSDTGGTNVLNLLRDATTGATLTKNAPSGTTGIGIDTGLTDVSADSIIRYSGFGTSGTNGIITSGLTSGVTFTDTPVQTLLLLYNNTVYPTGTTFPVNFTRTQVRNIISGIPNSNVNTNGDTLLWSDIDPRLSNTLYVAGAYRESTSGTRITELTNIQRYNPQNTGFLREGFADYGTNPGPSASISYAVTGVTINYAHTLGIASGNNPQNGTGGMLGTANHAANATGAVFGYAFVTGGAGNNRANVNVGLFNGVAPYRRDPVNNTFAATDGAAIPLPNNGTQPSYTTVANTNDPNGNSLPYYTETINGRYELWSYSRALSNNLRGTATFNSILGGLNSPANTFRQIVHRAGLTQLQEMQATRSSFSSSLVAGEIVTDGLTITLDINGDVDLTAILD